MRSDGTRALFWVLAGFSFTIFNSAAFAQFRFSVTSIAPDLQRGRALAINDNGTVIGMYGQEETSQSFLWSPDSGLQLLPPLPQAQSTRVLDINNPGAILASDTGGNSFLLENGTYSPLSVEAGSFNDQGQFAGTHYDNFTSPSAFRWTNGAKLILPLPSGSQNSTAIDINQAGAVAGAIDYYPALWEADDTAHILSSIDHGYAYDVNKFLFVTGNVGPRAFVWTPTGGLELLDHHPAAPIGSTDTAIAINDAGHAVGYSEILPNENDLAFFWTADEKMMDLNALLDSSGEGWILQVAWDINNHDQIVGFGTYNGEQRAFLLTPTPIPEPASMGCALAPLFFIWLRSSRRRQFPCHSASKHSD